jgi:hypothetical protein
VKAMKIEPEKGLNGRSGPMQSYKKRRLRNIIGRK